MLSIFGVGFLKAPYTSLIAAFKRECLGHEVVSFALPELGICAEKLKNDVQCIAPSFFLFTQKILADEHSAC